MTVEQATALAYTTYERLAGDVRNAIDRVEYLKRERDLAHRNLMAMLEVPTAR